MDILFDKLFRYDRIKEHCSIAVPVKEGALKDVDKVQILKDGNVLPIQKAVTSRHKDGSVRYMFLRFMADLPGNAKTKFDLEFDCDAKNDYKGIAVDKKEEGITVDNGKVSFTVKNDSDHLFDILNDGNKTYTKDQFVGPVLKTGGEDYKLAFGKWEVYEEGNLVTILRNNGKCIGRLPLTFECKITVYADKEWIEVSYRLINSCDEEIHVESLVFAIMAEDASKYNPTLVSGNEGKADSTGCGDAPVDNTDNFGPVFMASGTKELPMIQERIGSGKVRCSVGRSNYKTSFKISSDESQVSDVITAAFLVSEANEHFAEVMYGTFFADRSDDNGGVCATIFQAQQNYPKAVMADGSGVYVMLVPENVECVKMASGMSREQKFLLHFHSGSETLADIDNRSLIYQMPDKPHLLPTVFKDANVMLDIFVDKDKIIDDVEIALISKADSHARSYGMMNWGDAPDPGYTSQGRGQGRLVWTNNEYDYPHSMYLMFARTGVRRFLDYANVAASHWMDVDVCHYSKDPLRVGGQWEHTMGHCGAGIMVCSHEWVEGLIDCYHFTGDRRAYETAIGIGENVLRLLETPMYQTSGESNARETGWALRTLTALYLETWDEKWIAKCEWIVGHFQQWVDEYGEWVAPYTDNTTIRVGFMISVAIGSLMRYYRAFPSEDLKKLMIGAVDDLVDNCMLDNGLFYYKELPSLQRNGNNTLLLEALTIGYELTGNTKYLEYGKKTFFKNMGDAPLGMNKRVVEDAVIVGNTGTKNFAQCFIPLTVYYKAMTDNNMM